MARRTYSTCKLDFTLSLFILRFVLQICSFLSSQATAEDAIATAREALDMYASVCEVMKLFRTIFFDGLYCCTAIIVILLLI